MQVVRSFFGISHELLNEVFVNIGIIFEDHMMGLNEYHFLVHIRTIKLLLLFRSPWYI